MKRYLGAKHPWIGKQVSINFDVAGYNHIRPSIQKLYITRVNYPNFTLCKSLQDPSGRGSYRFNATKDREIFYQITNQLGKYY